MQVIPIHYTPSLEVLNWATIEKEAEEVAKLVDHRGGMFALHHTQVSEKPFNFFVLHAETMKDFIPELGSRFIVNPQILSYLKSSEMALHEGCVSFPHRKPIKVRRAIVIRVRYQIPDAFSPDGLQTKEMEVSRIVAQIFQHECEHAVGRNIYFDGVKK